MPPLPDGRLGWQADAWDLMGPFHAWRAARRAWSIKNGDELGTWDERLTDELAVRRALIAGMSRSCDVLTPNGRTPHA